MAMRSFYNEIGNIRLKDLPAHIKPMLSPSYIKDAGTTTTRSTSSPAPSTTFTMSASAAWPLLSPTSWPSPRSAATSSTSCTPWSTPTPPIDPSLLLYLMHKFNDSLVG